MKKTTKADNSDCSLDLGNLFAKTANTVSWYSKVLRKLLGLRYCNGVVRQIPRLEGYRISLILNKHSLRRFRGGSTISGRQVIWTLFAN